MHPTIPALLSLLLPSLCSAYASSAAQVYLHPPVSSTAPSTSATALLAHHLGLEAYETLSQTEGNGEVVLGGVKTFVGQGSMDALLVSVDASHLANVLPESLRPSFKLPASSQSVSSLLERYSRLAHTTYASVFDSSSSSAPTHPTRFLDVFAVPTSSSDKSDALEAFMGSLSSLVAFVEESRSQDDAGERFGAFEVRGLSDIETLWGRDSELYRTATSTLKATLQSAISSHLALALISSSQSSTLHARQPPQSPLPIPGVPDTAPIFSTSTCHTSAQACANATASCSSRGECVGVTRAARTCFVCECGKAPLREGGKNVSWAGAMCQKKDLSQQFTLIAGTVLFLILASVGSIALLYTVGDQELPGTLTGGIGGHVKRE